MTFGVVAIVVAALFCVAVIAGLVLRATVKAVARVFGIWL